MILAHTGEIHGLQFLVLAFAVLLPALAIAVTLLAGGSGKK